MLIWAPVSAAIFLMVAPAGPPGWTFTWTGATRRFRVRAMWNKYEWGKAFQKEPL